MLILFATCFSLGVSGSNFPTELLVLVADYSHNNQSIRDVWYTRVLNKYNLFETDTRFKLFSFLKIETPPLFLTCKKLYTILHSRTTSIEQPKLSDSDKLERHLLFLSQFKLSLARKYYTWQTLTDQYFHRYEKLIKTRNQKLTGILKFNNQDAHLFHTTIDFYRKLHDKPKKILATLEVKDLNPVWDDYGSPMECIDIYFLQNFNLISYFFNKSTLHEKIEIYNQCLISYLLSSFDLNLNQNHFRSEEIEDFLQTKTKQKKLIVLLKKLKKKIKNSCKEIDKRRIRNILFESSLYPCPTIKKGMTLLLKIAIFDPEFFISQFKKGKLINPKRSYIVIKSAYTYCNNENERNNFIKNFQKDHFLGNTDYSSIFNNKKPNILSKIYFLLLVRTLKSPSYYSSFLRCFFFEIITAFIVLSLAISLFTLKKAFNSYKNLVK